MGKIAILPDILCNQIAAGEVVERPAAVVKELVENSLDAGAGKIAVSLLQGGRKEIRVVDDGCGMGPDDALLALERHATSKIRRVEDLASILSLGFRGEAIPSIAAVSRFEILTREAEALSGTRIRVEGGVVREVKEAGAPPGTLILVRDLFYNVPARRKFLRSVETELAHIVDQFLRTAVARPDVHFQLVHQERLLHDLPRTRSGMDRAGQVLGRDVLGKLRPFALESGGVRLSGYAGAPDLQRGNGNALMAFVNARPIWDRVVTRAVLAAYESLIPRGRFPVAVLFIEMPPERVDVNVHPTKREVRFRDPGDLQGRIRAAIREALEGTGSVPGRVALSPPGGILRPRAEDAAGISAGEVQMPIRTGRQPLRLDPLSPAYPMGSPSGRPFSRDAVTLHAFRERMPEAAPPDETPEPAAPGGLPGAPVEVPGRPFRYADLTLIGQYAGTYLILESPDGLVLIDQHAAHERILYDGLMEGAERAAAQRLLRPVLLDLPAREAVKLRAWAEALRKIGFEVEPFGGDSFLIHAVPPALAGLPPDAILREAVEAAAEEADAPLPEVLSRLAKTAACHGAIRAGQRLRSEEIRDLLARLDATRFPHTCPHGRPLYVRLAPGEIARLFQRT